MEKEYFFGFSGLNGEVLIPHKGRRVLAYKKGIDADLLTDEMIHPHIIVPGFLRSYKEVHITNPDDKQRVEPMGRGIVEIIEDTEQKEVKKSIQEIFGDSIGIIFWGSF